MAKTKPLIVIVEDEKELAALIAEQLEVHGMMTQMFHRVQPAVRFLTKNFANLILLDINLPDGTGFELIDELQKANVSVPTIFLTANTTEAIKVKGFEVGGDDYVTKPFSFPELIARINAVLRRSETLKDANITRNARLDEKPFPFCGAEINPQRMELVFPDGKSEKIGRKELGILVHVAGNPHVVLTRQSLIHAVWGVHADVRSRSLDQYIVRIREAFGRHGGNLNSFRTIHGVGYIYDHEEKSVPAPAPAVAPAATAPARGAVVVSRSGKK
jgi:DNA-binding response OmpR family regulator